MAVFNKQRLPSAKESLPGRSIPVSVPSTHFINGHSLECPFPENIELIYLGMGCFWGAERLFWQQEGVWTTAVGYMGGYTRNPSYEEVCSGLTGHAEVVMVGYDPQIIASDRIIRLFWESHDPTQGMRQGNDKGTQYRSAIFVTSSMQHELAITSLEQYQRALGVQGGGKITTDIQQAGTFYYAEEYHQQYLGKNPEGYCGIGGTGVCLPKE